MPNWCENEVTLTHSDPAEIKRLAEAFNAGKFFSAVMPEPDYTVTPVAKTYPEIAAMHAKTPEDREKALKNEPTIREDAWWDWRVSHWGTKWEVGMDKDRENYAQVNDAGTELFVYFDSAWSPPTGVYEELRRQGFGIAAYYWESGMGFCGRFTTEYGDETFDDNQPPLDIDRVFNLREQKAEWQREMEEEED